MIGFRERAALRPALTMGLMGPSAQAPDERARGAAAARAVALLSSMRFTVGMLALAAAACAGGMVIPQGEPRGVYEKAYGRFLANVLHASGLTDVYHSWWFILLMAAVCVSVLVCTVRRCVLMCRPPAVASVVAHQIAHSRHRLELESRKPPPEASEAASGALSRAGYRVRSCAGGDGCIFVLGLRGKVGARGGILMHAGLAVTLIGAAYGHLPPIRLGSKVLLGQRNIDAVRHVAEGEKFRPPGARFEVRLVRLRIPVDDLGRVRQYYSDLEILEGGRVIARPTVSVNYPYSRDGLSLYQTEWSLRGFVVKVTGPDGRAERVFVPVRPEGYNMMDSLTRLEIPNWIMFVHEFYPDGVETDGRVSLRSTFPVAPAARIFVDRRGTLKPPWDFHSGAVGWVWSDRDTCFQGYCFRIERLLVTSGIGVRREPGLSVVWLGFAMLCLGVVAAFVWPASTLAVRIKPGPRGSDVAASFSGGVAADPARQLQNLHEVLRNE